MDIEKYILELQNNNILELSKKEFCDKTNIDFESKNIDLNTLYVHLPIKFHYNKVIIQSSNLNSEIIENNIENNIEDNILYLKNTKENYKYIINEEKQELVLKYFKGDRGLGKIKDDLVIPFSYIGIIKDPLILFEKLNFYNFGWFKKGLTFLFIILILSSIYHNPSNLVIYAIIYIVFFFLYLFNEKNKNYLKVSIFTPSDNVCYNFIFLFKTKNQKENFNLLLKKYNNILLKTQTDLLNVKNSIKNIIKGKPSEDFIKNNNDK